MGSSLRSHKQCQQVGRAALLTEPMAGGGAGYSLSFLTPASFPLGARHLLTTGVSPYGTTQILMHVCLLSYLLNKNFLTTFLYLECFAGPDSAFSLLKPPGLGQLTHYLPQSSPSASDFQEPPGRGVPYFWPALCVYVSHLSFADLSSGAHLPSTDQLCTLRTLNLAVPLVTATDSLKPH